MKKTLLLAIAMMIGVAVMAQFRPAKISKDLATKAMPAPVKVDGSEVAVNQGNPFVNTKATLEEIIGNSRYDMQSNGSMMQRLYLWPDGSLAGTWTKGNADPSYSDRGTGYNYSDGSAWGPQPSARVETVRTGWPNHAPWMGNGEAIISHQSGTTPLVLNTRAVKGTGSWTQTLISAPAGASGLLWPRMVTSGNNHQYMHIITMAAPTANGGTIYQGQDGALLYYRSLDGGTTWDKAGVILPGMDASLYLGYGGDDYAFIAPHGDTIAFLVGGGWTDTFLMYSYDNGDTWTKKIIVPNYYGLVPHTVATPAFISTDGTIAGAMDKNGVFHVAAGRMRVACDGSGGTQYYPGTDGIVYWNSTQPPIDTAILTDIDLCFEAGILLGYVAANQSGDTIVDFPAYGTALSSFPQVIVDDWNNVYCLWSSLTVGNPSPDPYNYRHIWGRVWNNNKGDWEEMLDFNDGVLYMFQEYVYPAVAPAIKNDAIQMVYQTSSQPGSNIKDTAIPIHDVNIEYREVSLSAFYPVGIDNTSVKRNPVGKTYPNPVKSSASFNVNLEKASTVTIDVINVMGQRVMSMDKGTMNAGTSKFTIDASQLTSGIYFVTVKINGESYTQKMIVE